MVHEKQARRLVILGTGGTIAGRAVRAADNLGYVAGQVAVAELVASVPALVGVAFEVEQVAQIDSKDMGLPVWQALATRLAHHLDDPSVCGVVVTHGTDTLEETAFVLQQLLKPRKPVVLTCAMRPASALMPDGPNNLNDAVAVAVACEEGACGVLVVVAGQVHGATDVAKVHTYRLDAFDSGEAGPIACVEEGGLRQFRPWPMPPEDEDTDATALARFLAASTLPRVELITSHADAGGGMVQALLAQAALDPAHAVQGIVVAGTGNGTVHRALTEALEAASALGVPVLLTSRCARGRVVPHPGLAFVPADDLSPVKVRLALALALLAD